MSDLDPEDAIVYGQSIAANATAIYGTEFTESDGNKIAAMMLAVMDIANSSCTCENCSRLRDILASM